MFTAPHSAISAILIEDDTHERMAIRRALQTNVHELCECESAEEAIRRLKDSPSDFDVIISDFRLPGMNGLSLFRTLRQMKCFTPFILLTGHGSEEIAIEAFKIGVSDYLIKASHSGYLHMLPMLVAQVIQHHRLKTRNELLELSLAEANERFQQVMEHYKGIFWLTDFEEPRKSLYVSQTYEELWDRPAQALKINPLDWLEALHPIDRDRIQIAYQKLNVTGGYNEQYCIIRANGSIRRIHEQGMLIYNKSGQPYRIVRLAQDITDHTTLNDLLYGGEGDCAQFLTDFPGLAYLKDEQTRFRYLNPTYARVFNIQLQDWIGKTLPDVLPPDTIKQIQHNDEWVISHRQALETIEDAALDDGVHQYLTVKFPIFRKKQPPMLGGISIEITEQFKVEMQRDEFFSLSPDLMCMIGLDGSLKKINPAFEKLLGYTQEELLFQPLILFTHSDDRLATLAAFKQLIEEKDAIEFHNRIRDIRGNYLWLEWRAIPHIQEEIAYAVARDITERYEATQTLRRYEQIVSTSSDFLCFLDQDDCFQAVNQRFCDYFHLSLREMVGRHVRDFVGHEMFESQLKFHLEDCRTGREIRFQHKLKFPDDELRFMEAGLNPYVESDGSISGVTATWRDLTEQKRLERHVAQTQKMESMGTFAGGIAHDFNNILMAILGWAEMGALKFPAESSVHRYFEQIAIAGKRGRDLVQQILTFSRQTEHHSRPIDLGPVVEESLAFLRATLPAHIELRLIKHQALNMTMVFADPIQIQRIIMNLCSNAEHALRPDGGTVTIALDTITIGDGPENFTNVLAPGRYVQLTISDSGPGIPEHILPKIFDPFFTTKPAGEGTGMGLAVVHGIVKNLQGHLSVESSPGSGTAFHITIPEYLLSTMSSRAETPHAVDTKSGHILFVDDEVSITLILKEYMEHLGYVVTARNNAQDALETFRQHPYSFDCLITDQTMPRLGGDQLAREILRIRPNMPIILCTGFSHTIDMEKALAQGITSLLYKPVLLEQLKQTLATIFSRPTSAPS